MDIFNGFVELSFPPLNTESTAKLQEPHPVLAYEHNNG